MKTQTLKFSKKAITTFVFAATIAMVQGASAEEEISDEQMAIELGEVRVDSGRVQKRTKTVRAETQRRVEFDLDNQSSSGKSIQLGSNKTVTPIRAAVVENKTRGTIGN